MYVIQVAVTFNHIAQLSEEVEGFLLTKLYNSYIFLLTEPQIWKLAKEEDVPTSLVAKAMDLYGGKQNTSQMRPSYGEFRENCSSH